MSCRWLTIQQFADYVQVDHSTVRIWIKKGALTHMKINGMTRICESATDIFQVEAKKGVTDEGDHVELGLEESEA